MEQCLKNILEMKELIDIISCDLLIHMINIGHHFVDAGSSGGGNALTPNSET